MPPIDFDELASDAFEEIKCALSTDALYLPKAGGQISIRGPFDDRAQEVDPDTEIAISSNVYTLGIKLADLPNLPVKGDIVRIKNIDYRVIDSKEDGAPGVSTVLILQRVKGAQ